MKNPINHRKRARRAYRHLLKVTKKRGRITYGELAGLLGLHHRAAAWFLGVIQQHCIEAGIPPLQAIVVNKQSRIPGAGYVASERGGSAYKRTLKRVYAFDWPDKAPF